MATIFESMRGQNAGQQIALGWNAPTLMNFTALVGTDGKPFLPVEDRGGYLAGVIRPLPTGGIYYAGMPAIQLTHPWVSDGQIATLKTYRGNCTLKHHIEDSVGKQSVQTSNVIFNLDTNQLAGLQRRHDGYEGFVSTFVIVEVLS